MNGTTKYSQLLSRGCYVGRNLWGGSELSAQGATDNTASNHEQDTSFSQYKLWSKTLALGWYVSWLSFFMALTGYEVTDWSKFI